MYLKTAALSCVTECCAVVKIFCIVGKIFLLDVSHHFCSNTLQYFNLVMFEMCSKYLALAI